MPQRRLVSLLALAAGLAACFSGQPTSQTASPITLASAVPKGSPSPLTAALTTPPPATATVMPSPVSPIPLPEGTAGAPLPEINADDDMAEADRQDLLSLLQSSDVQVYLPEDMISDGSGAYFSAEALPRVKPKVRFRRQPVQNTARQLRLGYAPGTRDRAIAVMTVHQQTSWEIVTAAGVRNVPVTIQQIRELQATRQNRRWRLERVGLLKRQADTGATVPTVQSLILQADGKSLFSADRTSVAGDVQTVPVLTAGQQLTTTLTVAPFGGAESPYLLGLLRLPGTGGNERVQPDDDGVTFRSTMTVQGKPGIQHVGVDVVNLTALTQSPPRVSVVGWATTVRLQ